MEGFFFKYSNIIGELDKYTNIIDGSGDLKKQYKDSDPKWYQSIFNKYDEDLNLANQIVEKDITPNYCKTSIYSVGTTR